MATIHLTTAEKIEVEETFDELESLMIGRPTFITIGRKVSVHDTCAEHVSYMYPPTKTVIMPACINVNHIAYIQ